MTASTPPPPGATGGLPASAPGTPGLLDRLIRAGLENKLVVALALLGIIGAGLFTAPFDWELPGIDRSPVPVDAIPDIGENQQIVFVDWPGRSPQDIEDQVTYPLSSQLLGLPGVKTLRSSSVLGFAMIFVIFEEGVDFYWSRTRILEKLNSLSEGVLPPGVRPQLGPDATALGQVYWYTLEGLDPQGRPTGGWDLDELRSEQDWKVRLALLAVPGVSEVASVGGHVREYQIDLDPDAARAHRVTLDMVYRAVSQSNLDVGARTIEINRVEYLVRGVGYVKSLADLEQTPVATRDGVPITLKDVARVSTGPALRRGLLDKAGAEAVGGVVVVRYGENPLAVIKRVKARIAELAPTLRRKTLPDGTLSQVAIVPFYDRTKLIHETLNTLNDAIADEILVTILVVLVMVAHLRSSILISGLLPLAVLLTFVAMKGFGVDANVVALSGIAIAIGTIVDMGIVVCENILKHLAEAPPDEPRLETIFRATREVGGAVLTAVATTVVGFLPVFFMEGAEGKLFRPLAFTKTFALLSSIITALFILPPAAHLLLAGGRWGHHARMIAAVSVAVLAGLLGWWWSPLAGIALAALAAFVALRHRLPVEWRLRLSRSGTLLVVSVAALLLTRHWLPLGPSHSFLVNLLFVVLVIGGLLGALLLFQHWYERILRWCLAHKAAFLALPVLIVLAGLYVWLGPGTVLGERPAALEPLKGRPWDSLEDRGVGTYLRWVIAQDWNGRGKEFMPKLGEGTFLFMPTTMPHAGVEEARDVLQAQDRAIQALPEVESVIGKMGRANSPLDPAPLSMVETVVNYHPEYLQGADGRLALFAWDDDAGRFRRTADGQLIPDPDGRPFRMWRDHIRTTDDLWDEIVHAGELPGSTGAPKLQPIETRIVMLQTGMRAPMGIKVYGDDLATVEAVGVRIEELLKTLPILKSAAVQADRIVGSPYLEIIPNREALARYPGMTIARLQDVIEVAIGGRHVTTTVEGRERYPVRVRYPRELRDSPEALRQVLVEADDGTQIPLAQLADIRYRRGPQMIKSEDTRLVGYVLFDMQEGFSEVEAVEAARAFLDQQERVFQDAYAVALREASAAGRTLSAEEIDRLPGLNRRGCTLRFAGSYEAQVRSERRLRVLLPAALLVIFLILYFQFRHVTTSLLVFSGVAVAFGGGFLMLWLYAQPWFLDFEFAGANLRALFQVRAYNLSVAVWVGFLALFGIATDDGVVMGTYLRQRFTADQPATRDAVREATVQAGLRRVRPCLMTTATTILALIPVLTSTGRGSDVMVPMAIPSFGGMVIEVLTMLVVPVLYCLLAERRLKRGAG